MKTASPLGTAAAVLLQLQGLPVPPRDLWRARGLRNYVRDWSRVNSGSLGELELLLRWLDPGVEVRMPSDGSAHAVVLWKSDPDEGSRIAEAAEEILEAWMPFGVRFTWEMAWENVPMMTRTERRSPPRAERPEADSKLPVQVAEALLGLRRRPAVPPRVWIGIEATRPTQCDCGAMILANAHVDRFLTNLAPWRATFRIDQQTATPGTRTCLLTALASKDHLELLARPGGLDEVTLDGRSLTCEPVPRWPEYCRYALPEPLVVGRQYRLLGHGRDGIASPEIWLNPLLFEAVRFEERRRRYVRDPRREREGESYPNLTAGPSDEVVHRQPFAPSELRDAESDGEFLARARRMMLGRRIKPNELQTRVERCLARVLPFGSHYRVILPPTEASI